MPKSRRTQLVSRTQTAKKTRIHKASIIKDVRDAIDSHKSLYLFSYENMRSSKFKDIRMDLRKADVNIMEEDVGDSDEAIGETLGKNNATSRIFLGKNKVLQIAVGRTSEDEHADNLRHLSKRISGSVGLLLTNQPHKVVESYFSNLAEDDYARSGSVARKDVKITSDAVCLHPVSMVEYFRKLGLPVEVQNGQLALVGGQAEYVICTKGKTLSAEDCKLLVHFGAKLATFRVTFVCRWSDGAFEEL